MSSRPTVARSSYGPMLEVVAVAALADRRRHGDELVVEPRGAVAEEGESGIPEDADHALAGRDNARHAREVVRAEPLREETRSRMRCTNGCARWR